MHDEARAGCRSSHAASATSLFRVSFRCEAIAMNNDPDALLRARHLAHEDLLHRQSVSLCLSLQPASLVGLSCAQKSCGKLPGCSERYDQPGEHMFSVCACTYKLLQTSRVSKKKVSKRAGVEVYRAGNFHRFVPDLTFVPRRSCRTPSAPPATAQSYKARRAL